MNLRKDHSHGVLLCDHILVLTGGARECWVSASTASCMVHGKSAMDALAQKTVKDAAKCGLQYDLHKSVSM